jgi:hypothetical protein
MRGEVNEENLTWNTQLTNCFIHVTSLQDLLVYYGTDVQTEGPQLILVAIEDEAREQTRLIKQNQKRLTS